MPEVGGTEVGGMPEKEEKSRAHEYKTPIVIHWSPQNIEAELTQCCQLSTRHLGSIPGLGGGMYSSYSSLAPTCLQSALRALGN